MKSEHNASPTEDEEVIELTDILKSGSDAEEAIVELTDVVETVKAKPHDPVEAIDEDQPLELDELAIADDDIEAPLVDLTDALDPPGVAETGGDDISGEAQALPELDDAPEAGAEDEMVLDLEDALDTPEDDTVLDLGDALDTPEDDTVLDLEDALDTPEDDTVLDLEDALDTPEDDTVLDLEDALGTPEDDTVLDLEDALDTPEDDTVLDLEDALDTSEDEDTALNLDDTLVIDTQLDDTLIVAAPEADAGDDEETTADIAEEIEVRPEDLDLTEVLDAPEAEEDILELDTPEDVAALVDDAATIDTSLFDAPALEETLEVIEADPVEDTLDEASSLDEVPSLGEASSLDAEGLGGLDLDGVEGRADSGADTDEFDEVLDLGPAVDPAAAGESTAVESGPGERFGTDDAGDELDFKLDEMLAEAQAEMPDLDGDDTDMELDLSEALADAAADSADGDPEAILDIDAPPTAIPNLFDGGDDSTAEDEEEFDLISEDKIIDLDDSVAPDDLAEVASKPDNVIELADVTGGYPTVSPTSDLDADNGENDKPEAAESLLEDVFLDEKRSDDGLDAAEAATDEDLDLGIVLDGEEPAEEDEDKHFQLNEEMEKLEATLDDVFQDDDSDDMQLSGFANAVSPAAGSEESDMEVAPVAASLTDGTTQAPEAPVGDLPVEITEAVLDASVTRVIKTMYADRIEQMILDVIKEAVTAEIDKVKRSLGSADTDAE